MFTLFTILSAAVVAAMFASLAFAAIRSHQLREARLAFDAQLFITEYANREVAAVTRELQSVQEIADRYKSRADRARLEYVKLRDHVNVQVSAGRLVPFAESMIWTADDDAQLRAVLGGGQ